MSPAEEIKACKLAIGEVLAKFNCDVEVSEDGYILLTSDKDPSESVSLYY